MNADYDYFSDNKTDVLDELSEKNKAELMTLLNELFGNDTESYEEFKKATDQWRMK